MQMKSFPSFAEIRNSHGSLRKEIKLVWFWKYDISLKCESFWPTITDIQYCNQGSGSPKYYFDNILAKITINSFLFSKINNCKTLYSKINQLHLHARIIKNRKMQLKFPGSNYLGSNFTGHYSNGIIWMKFALLLILDKIKSQFFDPR